MSLVMLRAICRRQHVLKRQNLQFQRLNHDENKPPPPPHSSDQEKPKKYSRENVKRNVQGYVFERYFDYVKNYDKVLERKFPSAMNVYRVFLVGIKEFFSDMKKLVKVTKIVYSNGGDLRNLTRKEIELYYQMPRDMKRVAPVLLISALPFANYVIFPLAYMYPRTLLSPHFWSIQQKSDFQQIDLRNRLMYNRRVFRLMQAKLDILKKKDEPHYEKWNYILGLLGSGLHPTADDILEVKAIFTRPPYHLNSLSSKHLNHLCYLHDIHSYGMKRYRLSEKAYVIHHMDLAIKREGDVHNMPLDALKQSCFIRGLNPTNLSTEKMIEWLNEWVKVSVLVDGDNISLFLHLPILISYNHPNNWLLTH